MSNETTIVECSIRRLPRNHKVKQSVYNLIFVPDIFTPRFSWEQFEKQRKPRPVRSYASGDLRPSVANALHLFIRRHPGINVAEKHTYRRRDVSAVSSMFDVGVVKRIPSFVVDFVSLWIILGWIISPFLEYIRGFFLSVYGIN